ncbi:MAG: RDD family protein [Deltaproteobacteria bacterium]|nr:RDD family protein [Deltaproteobacteria bacterium]
MEEDNNANISKTYEPNESKDDLIICGFWRRLFAFIVDGIILGIFGLIIGTAFFDFFAEIGVLGRLFGFSIALLYFGIQNSFVCDGQTIGKRILKIKVVNKETETISLQRSFARFMILGLPYFLNGAILPPNLLNNIVISLLLGLIVFFGLAGIIYLYIFNKKTRQTLHDLAVGTYVVNTQNVEEFSFQPKNTWKGHLAVLTLLFITILFAITIVVPKFAQKDFFKELLIVQKEIQSSGLVHVSTVSAGKSFSTKAATEGSKEGETTYFSIRAVLNKKPSDYNIPINNIAKIVLDKYPSIMEKDALVINVTYGYDIGIAQAWINQSQQYTPKEWHELISRLPEETKI